MTDETLAERLARCVKPLSWERLDDTGRFWRAPAPLFGNIRVEAYGGPYRIAYSVPGFSHTFTEGEFDTPEVAMRAAQADYQSRILAALDMDALAQEVEAMVGAEREACAGLLNEAARCLRDDASKADDAGHDTSADMDRECARVLDGMAVSIRHRGSAAAIRAREGGKP
jgi:hypothetical protein